MYKQGPLLIDIKQASAMLGLTIPSLRKAVFRKTIPYRKIGGMVRFIPQELYDWINSDNAKPKLNT